MVFINRFLVITIKLYVEAKTAVNLNYAIE